MLSAHTDEDGAASPSVRLELQAHATVMLPHDEAASSGTIERQIEFCG